jgi:excisionase family DNA binding protein
MSDFLATATEGLNLDALIERMAEKVAARLQNGDQRAPVNGEVRPRLLTVEQAAVYIGRTKDAIQHMIASCKLPTVRSDRRVFIDMRDLDAWIEGNKRRGLV